MSRDTQGIPPRAFLRPHGLRLGQFPKSTMECYAFHLRTI